MKSILSHFGNKSGRILIPLGLGILATVCVVAATTWLSLSPQALAGCNPPDEMTDCCTVTVETNCISAGVIEGSVEAGDDTCVSDGGYAMLYFSCTASHTGGSYEIITTRTPAAGYEGNACTNETRVVGFVCPVECTWTITGPGYSLVTNGCDVTVAVTNGGLYKGCVKASADCSAVCQPPTPFEDCVTQKVCIASITGTDRLCNQGIHTNSHTLTVTIEPAECLPGTLSLRSLGPDNPEAMIIQTNGVYIMPVDSVYITVSPTYVVITGIVAGASMVAEVETAIGGICATQLFDVVDLKTNTLNSLDCSGWTPQTDTEQSDDLPDPADPAASLVEFIQFAEDSVVTAALTQVWVPESSEPVYFETVPTNSGWTPASGSFATSGVPVFQEWATGSRGTNDHQTWFDCDGDGDRDSDEPKRKLQSYVAFFEHIRVAADTGLELLENELMPGHADLKIWLQKSHSSAGANREYEWTSVGNAGFTSTYTNSVAPSLTSDSGTHMLELEVEDSEHPGCVTETARLWTGCSSCSSCSGGSSGGCMIGNLLLAPDTADGTFAIGLGNSVLWFDAFTNAAGSWINPSNFKWPRERRYENVLQNYAWSDGLSYQVGTIGVDSMITSYNTGRAQATVAATVSGFSLTVTVVGSGSTTAYDFNNSPTDGSDYIVTVTRNGEPKLTLTASRSTSGGIDTVTYNRNDARTTSQQTWQAGSFEHRRTTVAATASPNTILSDSREKLAHYPWGDEVVERVNDPDGAALTDTIEYHTVSGQPGYSRVKQRTSHDGSWARYEYDNANRLISEARPVGNAGPAAPDSQCVVRTNSYAALDESDIGDAAFRRPRTTTRMVLGQAVDRRFMHYSVSASGELTTISKRAASPSAGYEDSGNLRTRTLRYPSGNSSVSAGKVKERETPTGRLTLYEYAEGTVTTSAGPGDVTFTPAAGGDHVRTIALDTVVGSPSGVAGQTTRSVTIATVNSCQIYSAAELLSAPDTWTPLNWTHRLLDGDGRMKTEWRSDGTRSDQNWGCCHPESSTSADGTVTVPAYDELDNMDIRTQAGWTGGGLELEDRTTSSTFDAAGRRCSTYTPGSQATTNVYDDAGRLLWSRDQTGVVTSNDYSYGSLTSVVVRAGVTNLTVRYLDGRTHYTEVNGTRKTTLEYGIEGTDGRQYTTTYIGPSGTSSATKRKAVTDMQGRSVINESPAFGGGTLTGTNMYNSAGQLVRTSSAGSVPTLYQYDEWGVQVLSALDINTNGTVDLSGPDRVTSNATAYVEEGGVWYRKSVSVIYAEETGATPTTTSVSRVRLTHLGTTNTAFGVLTAEQITSGVYTNETVARTYIDRDSRTVTKVVDAPDSELDAVSITVNGLMVTNITKSGIAYGYAYDSDTWRRTGVTDPRWTNESTTGYNAQGQVAWQADAAGNTNWFSYDADTGRRAAVTNALGEVTHYHYSAEGQLLATWGNVYPVAYEYDDFDRMSAMYTYSGSESIASYADILALIDTNGMDRTQWLYDEATGLLTNKLYADGNGTAYDYSSEGRLSKRTWARDNSTEYAYDDCCGALTNISYLNSVGGADPVTTNIVFSYDRLGRKKSITDAAGAWSFGYDPDTLALTNETLVTHDDETYVITRSQDANNGRSDGLSLDDDYSVNYGYSTTGRLNQIEWTVGGSSYTAAYSFVENSDMIGGYSIDVGNDTFAALKTFEADRNLIKSVSNFWDTTSISSFGYGNDALGRRTNRVDGGSVTNDFAYDALSQVTNAVMDTDAFSYAYDPIGNRETASSNAVDWTYLANDLNQYTNISNGGVELPEYDADGNLTNWNGWALSWNGENRLINASNQTTQISYSYDYRGRMFEKVTDGVTNSLIWDGFNIIAELSNSQTNYNVWGLDISGRMQGAGGIGGLLATVQDGETYFTAYDANGNVTEYVDTNGTVAAHRAYGPFGETIALSGNKKEDFTHWWSTKPWDPITGLSEYEYRKYSPELGRWPSRDPIGEKAFGEQLHQGNGAGATSADKVLYPKCTGPNPLSFASNRPVDKFDVLGLISANKIYELTLEAGSECCPSCEYDALKSDRDFAVQAKDVFASQGDPGSLDGTVVAYTQCMAPVFGNWSNPGGASVNFGDVDIKSCVGWGTFRHEMKHVSQCQDNPYNTYDWQLNDAEHLSQVEPPAYGTQIKLYNSLITQAEARADEFGSMEEACECCQKFLEKQKQNEEDIPWDIPGWWFLW
ncbi:MAG: RHS repeat protein [Verrucomicrobia bacterium]|jgi:RHS repeat-associated protein|nr:RHS repeat protein [Verrucomicrobiota bacterium]